MSFVSYSQNFEDVMLWRALKHIKNGCYIDVGAQHPVIDSVSKAFYQAGWRGIHFEPTPQYANLLRMDRPEDIVIEAALSDVPGILELNVFHDTGLSTLVDEYADRHEHIQALSRERIHVPVLTLKSGLEALAGREVHWLKIDVEGHEEKVLKGWDSTTLRPWIMVIEATKPGSPEVDYENWDRLVKDAGYVFVYFDGLNRFYIAQEKPELHPAFYSPPNVFDEIVLTEHSSLCQGVMASNRVIIEDMKAERARIENLLIQTETALQSQQFRSNELQGRLHDAGEIASTLKAQMDAALIREQQLQSESQHWWSLANRLTAELGAIQNSRSWRMTKPLRQGMYVLHMLSDRSNAVQFVKQLIKRVAKPIVRQAMRYVLSSPRLQKNTLDFLASYPHIKQKLRLLAVQSQIINAPLAYEGAMAAFPLELVDGKVSLSPRAEAIYTDLKQFLEKANN